MWIQWVAKHDEYFIFYFGMLQGMELPNQNCLFQRDEITGLLQ